MSAESPRRSSGSRGMAIPAIVPPQVVSDRSILDSAIGFINEVTLTNQPITDPKDTITWARFETAADISDPRFGEDWELEGNVAPPLLLILGYGLGVQVWAIPANGEAVEVLSWRHGIVSALRVLPTPISSGPFEDEGRADEPADGYAEKRPLIALVDGSTAVGSQPQFCTVTFISLKTGTQVKTIKFKSSVLDVLANRSSIVITFNERIAVFDARTLEDRLSITTCFPSPGINPNPVALGPRWLAYAEHKLLHNKRSGGGCDGDGVASYTATMLNAAKSFGKGLRDLGGQVAAGFTGTTAGGGMSKNNSFDSASGGDLKQPGVVTILDIKNPIKDYSPTSGTPIGSHAGSDPVVAHFIAHSDAIVGMEFDNSGLLLITADRRGHDFHIFRIHPHPVGSSLAAVHHLYILHRGDTSSKVQNIAFSLDSRWVAVSTLRGTTHVFPVTPYGGPMGYRTHTSLHVVNKLSRFHRSAGLSAEGRSSSPISHSESTTFMQSLQPYHNPTLPPYPRPIVVLPLAQLRQPFVLGSPPGSANLAMVTKTTPPNSGGSTQRQRHTSLSDDNGKPLSVCAIFAKSRSWLLDPPNVTREAPHRILRKAVDALFVMAGHGALIQYDLDVKLAPNVAKEKICDDTPIELEVEAKAQWNLGRRKDGSQEIKPPLPTDNWLVKDRNSCMLIDSTRQYDDSDDRIESWLSQVEIITHAGPHRRLWMGPQFVFKTYNTPSGSNLNHVDAEAVEIGVMKPTNVTPTPAVRGERSSPLNMPLSAAARSTVPVLIESGSYSSIEQSPKLMDRFRHEHLDSDFAVAHGDTRLKEDLADAMRESPSVSTANKDAGRPPTDATSCDNAPFYDALAEHDEDAELVPFETQKSSSMAALASVLPNICSYDLSSGYESLDLVKKPNASVEKIVNPLGTVTTLNSAMATEVNTDILDEVVSQLAAEDCVIHENCDESLFRPVVAIFCDAKGQQKEDEQTAAKKKEECKPPEAVGNKLIVPVIAKERDAELSKKEQQKSNAKTKQQQQQQPTQVSEASNKNDGKVKLNVAKEASGTKERSKNLIQEQSQNEATKGSQNTKPEKEKSDSENKKATPKMTNVSSDIEIKASLTSYEDATKKIPKAEPKVQSTDMSDATSKNITDKNTAVEEKTTTVESDKAKTVEKPSAAKTEQAEKTTTSTEIKTSKSAKESAELALKEPELKKSSTKKHTLLDDSLKALSFNEKSAKSTTAEVNIAPPVEIYAATKSTKKSRKKQNNKSGSNSESEEVVEVTASSKTSGKSKQKSASSSETEEVLDPNTSRAKNSKRKSLELKELEKKLQAATIPTADDSPAIDSVDNILTNKSKMESSMFLSFSKTEERSKVKATADDDRESMDDEVETKNTQLYKKDKPDIKLSKSAIITTQTSTKDSKGAEKFHKEFEELAVATKDIDTRKNESYKEPEKNSSKMVVSTNELKEVIVISDRKDSSDAIKPAQKSPKKTANDIHRREQTFKPTQQEESAKTKPESKKTEKALISHTKAAGSKSSSLEDVTDGFLNSKTIEKKTPLPPTPSVWKTLSGADMLKKNADNSKTTDIADNYPSLEQMNKTKKSSKSSPTGNDAAQNLTEYLATTNKMENKPKKLAAASIDFDDFPILGPLDALPPLPSLEPLETLDSLKTMTRQNDMTKSSKDVLTEQMSLINLDSPLQDNPAMPRKIVPPPKGFTDRNLIFALCGSLHYENESSKGTNITADLRTSLNEQPPTNEYHLLPDNDEKYSCSSNSSASEEVIILEEKKMSKKQRRKKLQMELQKQKRNATMTGSELEPDEELRPLITMTDSQQDTLIDTTASTNERYTGSLTCANSSALLLGESFSLRAASCSHLAHSSTTTTTDSEGPMPATTSDDNVFIMPNTSVSTPHKVKTKKLEHKINLIAAIEAATSSSTSSAEESGVEAGGRGSDLDAALVAVAATPTMPLSQTIGIVAQQSGSKKKTKRRKR